MNKDGITIVYSGKLNTYYGPANARSTLSVDGIPNGSMYIETTGEHEIWIFDGLSKTWSEF